MFTVLDLQQLTVATSLPEQMFPLTSIVQLYADVPAIFEYPEQARFSATGVLDTSNLWGNVKTMIKLDLVCNANKLHNEYYNSGL